jgi:hypothetical protein
VTCDKFLSPSTVRPDGTCPVVESAVGEGTGDACAPADEARAPVTNLYGEPIDDEDDAKVPLPWHLKLLAGALAVYLGYRFFQGIEWVFGA